MDKKLKIDINLKDFLEKKVYTPPTLKALGGVKKITLNGPGECPDSGATWDFPFGDCNQTS